MMDSRSSFYDLANAPPLLNDSEMEVTMTGEKRKTTPPDLLTLSNMYFEKTQVLFRDHSYTCYNSENQIFLFPKVLNTNMPQIS